MAIHHQELTPRPSPPSLSQKVLTQNLMKADFTSPAKIFQSNHNFENVTPDVSIPGTPGPHEHDYVSHDDSLTSSPHHAPVDTPSLTPRNSGEKEPQPTSNHRLSSPRIAPASSSSSPSTPLSLSRPPSDEEEKPVPSASTSTSIPSRPSTPSQFQFKKPQYNHKYHQTHFHHLEKKDTLFHGLKRFFKGDKKKKKHQLRDGNVYSNSSSDLSFANDFNRDIEGRYGKWGKYFPELRSYRELNAKITARRSIRG